MVELLINKQENVKTIMLVENGILVEKHEEHEHQKRLEGNIYIGTVKDVLNGMQSAFIDIGENKNTLIKLKDLFPRNLEEEKQDNLDKKISDYIKPNQELVVQIKKDGTLTKGAKVSTHINLPGRFFVLLPEANYITISQKIESKEERERLKKIVEKYLPKNMGAILRTASEGANEETIKNEIEVLIREWQEIEKKKETSKIRLLYDNNALIRRTVIDIVDRGLEKIIVNDEKIYNEISALLKSMNANIELVLKKNEDLFKMYSIEEQISKMNYRRIWLKCGGFITIEKTEALTAIDVNTGKYTGNKNLEQTIYKVNEEATYEIAKQLRLRDIGGIIIIDYIDMHKEGNKESIQEILKNELKKDRTKCQIIGFTKLNLLEMTRKNMCNNDWDNKGEE